MTDKTALQYTIATDSLDTLQFTELSGSNNIGISVPSGRTYFSGEVIEEPAYTNKVVSEPTGKLHVREIKETYVPSTSSAWKYAIAVKDAFLTSGGNFTFDSFNSNNGPYTGSQRSASSILVSRSGTYNVSTDKIYGYMGSSISKSFSSNASVGDLNWVGGGSGSTQPGHNLYDAFSEYWHSDLSVFNVTPAPFTTADALPGFGNVVMSASADYTGSSISLTAGRSWTIVSGSNIRLKLSGNLSLGGGLLSIDSGSSLKVYTDGTVTLSTSNITNFTASHFIIYTPTTTTVTIGNTIYLCIECPNAGINGGSSTNFTGYIIAKSANFSGGGGFFHFDEASTRPIAVTGI